MNRVIGRFSAATLTVAIIVLFSGCGGEAKKSGVMELLAQAQELQQTEKWEDAIRTYRKIAREYPETKQGANSQFMIGYIYANHLKDTVQAKTELNRFLENFADVADSGLVVGAKFEMKYMGMDIEDIPVLSEIGIADTSIAEQEGGAE